MRRFIGNQIKVAAENIGPQTCFRLDAGATGSTITGLAIVNTNYGIYIQSNSNCHMIYGNRIGTDWADTTGLGNNYGIYVLSHFNRIGGNAASTRNVISDNTSGGIFLGTGSSHNVITGNYIGLNNAGSAGLGVQSSGIWLGFSRENLIGGDRSAGYGNVISNNTNYGIILEGAATSGNTMCGNIVGGFTGRPRTDPGLGLRGHCFRRILAARTQRREVDGNPENCHRALEDSGRTEKGALTNPVPIN